MHVNYSAAVLHGWKCLPAKEYIIYRNKLILVLDIDAREVKFGSFNEGVGI